MEMNNSASVKNITYVQSQPDQISCHKLVENIIKLKYIKFKRIGRGWERSRYFTTGFALFLLFRIVNYVLVTGC